MTLSDLSEDGRCRRLVEAMANYVIYIPDPEGIVWSWNADAQRFKGYEASEIIGCTFRDSTRWRMRKDALRFWAHVVIDPIRDRDGSTRDLTEQKKAWNALQKSEQQFRLLVQAVTDSAIYMLDKHAMPAKRCEWLQFSRIRRNIIGGGVLQGMTLTASIRTASDFFRSLLARLSVLSDWGRLSQAAPFLPSAIGGFSFPQVTRFSSRSAHRPPHDGVRRAKRPNLFHDLADLLRQAQDSKRDRLAHRPHGNDAFRSRGFKFQLVHSPFYAVAAINFGTPAGAAFSLPNRNAESSIHIRWRMVASLRATATLALAMPRRLAILMPHARRADHLLLQTKSECAAS